MMQEQLPADIKPEGLRPLRANPKWLGLCVVLGAALIGLASLYRAHQPSEPTKAPGITVTGESIALSSGAPQWKVLRLGTAQSATESWSDAFPARVKVDEALASKLGAPLAGRVAGVFVELGQAVKVGAPLFSVISPDIAGLRSEREKSRVDLDVAKASFERVKAMVEARALPAKDELETDQRLRQAELTLRLAETKLKSLHVSSTSDNEFTVVSPRDGYVIEKNVLLAQQINQSDSLMSVADVSHVWVVADLFEQDAMGIVADTPARITSPSLPGFALDDKVEMVSAVVDPEKHTVAVRIKIPNSNGKIRPNMYSEVRFMAKPSASVVQVAATALIADGSKQYVYVQEGEGKFLRRFVEAGSARQGKVLVSSGLKEGDVVVEQGAILLDNQVDLAH